VPWGCITAKHAKLYLHVFDWPKDNQVLVPSKAGGALSARMLADRTRRPLACERTDAGVRVTLEPGFQNPYASVAVLGVGATTK
jgi:alpha-L-fucosidase